MSREPISPRAYGLVAVALIALTLLTVVLARAPLGSWHLAVALAIAAAKAMLIAVYFMHLRVADPVSRLALAAGVLWLLILCLGTMDDYATRAWLPGSGK